MIIKGVSAIIFDLGGVILNIDYDRTVRAFQDLGFKDFDNLYSQARQSGLFDSYEKGMMEEGEFIHQLKELSGIKIEDHRLIEAWNAMLLDFPVHRLEVITELRRNNKVYLLSNTNYTHQVAFEKILQEEAGLSNLEPYFDKVYYSHHLGMRKPDREIFDFVISDNGLNGEETLFIDDSPQHVEGAKQTGIQAHLLKDSDVTSLINSLI